MADLKRKRIITVAATGVYPQKSDNPNVPITPEEIAEDVYACWKAGAAVAHIHMRDENGIGRMDKVRFRKTVELIRTLHTDCDIILNLTSSGDADADEESRVAHIRELKPEMASFDCGTMNWMHTTIFNNSPKFLEMCGKLYQECGTKPEIEVFDPGMIGNAAYYLKKGVIKAPLHLQFCMGCANGIPGTVKNLVFMKETADELLGKDNYIWSTFGVGKSALQILYTGIALGGHIRVGMEDNVLYRKNQLADSNAQFVARAKRLIEEFDCEAATPEEAREILSLK